MADVDDEIESEFAPDSIEFDWGDSDPDSLEEGPERDVLRFQVSGRAVCAEVGFITEITPVPQITNIPGLPDHVIGVTMMRRSVVSIVDLARFFGIGHTKIDVVNGRLIVVTIDDITAALAVVGDVELEVWDDDSATSMPRDVEMSLLPYVSAARWAPGGRILLLDVPHIIRTAAVR